MTDEAARATILVVDDEPPLLRFVARVLEQQGYATLAARDGVEAVRVFDEHCEAIDGVVLDVVIPPNGVGEVIDHILAARDDLAIVFASGDVPNPEISAKIKSCGAAFLRKPFLPRALLDLVERGLAASSANERIAAETHAGGS